MPNKFEQVDLNNYRPLREVIFNTLRKAIVQGDLAPGERLMEVKLAEKMGVSRTPVREAIRKLEIEGLVIMEPRKGVYVAEVTNKDVNDVLELRSFLDGFATRLAAKRMDKKDLDKIKEIQKEFESFAKNKDLDGAIKKDIEFHELVYNSSKNEKLIQILNNLREQVDRFRVIYLKQVNIYSAVTKEHKEIIAALESANEEQSEKAAIQHIISQQENFIK